MANKQQKKKSPVGKIILFVVEIILLISLLVVLWVVLKATDEDTGVERVELFQNEEKIIVPDKAAVNKEVQDNDVLKGYILIGRNERAGIYTSMIREKTPISSVNFDVLRKAATTVGFSKETRKDKFSVPV